MKKLKILADVSACYAVLRSCKVPPRSNQVIEPRFRGLMALELQRKYQCILAEPENFSTLDEFAEAICFSCYAKGLARYLQSFIQKNFGEWYLTDEILFWQGNSQAIKKFNRLVSLLVIKYKLRKTQRKELVRNQTIRDISFFIAKLKYTGHGK